MIQQYNDILLNHNYPIHLMKFPDMQCDGPCCVHGMVTKPWVMYIPQIDVYFHCVWKCLTTAIRLFYGLPTEYKIYPHNVHHDNRFTIVRNPYSRMESIYKSRFANHMIMNHFQEEGQSLYIPFPEFVESTTRIKNHHWIPQTHFVPQDTERIFKMENLDPLWEFLGTRIPKINQSPVTRPINWTPTARKLIEDEYAEDFTRFGYKI